MSVFMCRYFSLEFESVCSYRYIIPENVLGYCICLYTICFALCFFFLCLFVLVYQVFYTNCLCADPEQCDGFDNDNDINPHLVHKETIAKEQFIHLQLWVTSQNMLICFALKHSQSFGVHSALCLFCLLKLLFGYLYYWENTS